jgi:hypothetical protein
MPLPLLARPAAPHHRRRPRWTDLGWHRLTLLLIALQAFLGVTFGVLAWRLGIRFDWASFRPMLGLVLVSIVGWLYFVRFPGREPSDWIVAEALLVFALVFSSALIGGPSQYVAAALNRPVIDPWLAAADRMLGVDVPQIVAWTAQYPRLVYLLWLGYASFLPQLSMAALVLGITLRDREALWEFVFHLHLTTVLTIVAFALWPAACVFTTLGFDALMDESRFIAHFAALRAGLLTTITYTDLEGLVSCPSFHVAMAIVVAWVCRRHRLLFGLMLIIDSTLIASTVLLGAHYAVDLVASVIMVAGSIWIYRRWATRLRERALPALWGSREGPA